MNYDVAYFSPQPVSKDKYICECDHPVHLGEGKSACGRLAMYLVKTKFRTLNLCNYCCKMRHLFPYSSVEVL